MTSCKTASFAVCAALLCALAAGPAAGRERGCRTFELTTDAGIRARWPELEGDIRASFAGRADIDACGRVELELEGDGIAVSVALPDGRAASRSVRAEDVIPTLEALLLIPEPAREKTAERPPLPAAGPSQSRAQVPSKGQAEGSMTGELGRGPASGENAARGLGIELSVLTGARAGDGQYGVGAGASSLLEVHGWLLGFLGRVDSYRRFEGSDPETALALAVLGGRRLYLGGAALDLSAGPAIAMKGITFAETARVGADETQAMPPPPPPPPPPTSEPSSGAVPRLLLSVRLGFGGRSILRTFVGIDAEVGPRHADTESLVSYSSRMPAYTVGLAVGATVGTP